MTLPRPRTAAAAALAAALRLRQRAAAGLAAALLAAAAPALAQTPSAASAASAQAGGEVFWREAPAQPRSSEMRGSLAGLAASAERGVLALSVERRGGVARDPGLGILRRQRGPSELRGSGFVISPDGYAITVSSLVAGSASLRAQLADGRVLEARLIGHDPRGRIALIKLESAEPLPALALGDSGAAAVGDWVIALGHADEREWEEEPSAPRSATLAKGVVAGLERRVENAEARLLQTDLVLVRGYSGAPLIDMNGSVIGIVDQELAPEGALGISFAIPIGEAKRVLTQLRDSGRVQRGWLGVQIQPLTAALVSRLQLTSRQGALVSDVLGGTPAELARIERGDVILEIDGVPLVRSSDLPDAVSRRAPGTRVQIAVLREGRRRELSAVLGAAPEDPAPVASEPARDDASPEPWGFSSEEATPLLARRYGLPERVQGFVVTSVDPFSPADRAGLAPGDLLREANGELLRERTQLDAALETASPLLRVQRGSSTVYRVLERR
jgi:serine protease Do